MGKKTETPHKKQLTGKIVCNYLERFPRQSSMGLAKFIYSENPLVFANIEHVRSMIRMYKGASGVRSRSMLRDERFLNVGPILPEGIETEYIPYQLPKVNNDILVLADVHIPFHDLKCIRVAIEDGRDKAVNTVILNGDILDFYDHSNFDHVPNKAGFLREREMFWTLIDDINSMIPGAKIFYLEGNHEQRYYRYMLRKSPAIWGCDEFSMESVFNMRELGIEYISGRKYIKAGNLNILHGHEFGEGSTSPVNPARTMYLKAKDNVLSAHQHQASEHIEPSIRGTQIMCYSMGCLCYLHPEYRPLNKWVNGHALVNIHSDGSFLVKNKKIINGIIN